MIDKSYLKLPSLLLITCGLFLLARFSPNYATKGDNLLYLVTSQKILSDGSIKLDEYRSDTAFQNTLRYGDWSLVRINGHYYNMFPLGTSLSALPFMQGVKWFGGDVKHWNDLIIAQRNLAALLVSLSFLLMYVLARNWLSIPYSILVAIVGVAGSQMMSTGGIGMWSHDFTVFWSLILIILLVKIQSGSVLKDRIGIYAGFLLFMIFSFRPNTAGLVFLTFIYLFFQNRRLFLITGVSSMLFLALFMVFSKVEFGFWIPPYYRPSRITGDVHFAQALWGNLMSTGRGLWVFTPWVLVGISGVFISSIRRNPLWLWAIGVFTINLLLISQFPHWWGGWCYGPRLQMDVIPALFVASVLVLSYLKEIPPARSVKLAIYPTIGLIAMWSVFVHSWQGLYEEDVLPWNGEVDAYPEEVLFNWNYPQFFAGFYPIGLVNSDAIIRNQIKQFETEIPAQSQFLIHYPIEHCRRLSRQYNRQNTFGDVHFFVDLKDIVAGKPIYTDTQGKYWLESNYPGEFGFVLSNDKSFGEWYRESQLHSDNWVAISSKNLNSDRFSPKSKQLLKEMKSELAIKTGIFPWAAVLHKDSLIWESTGPGSVLEFVPTFADNYLMVTADTGKAFFSHQLIRWAEKNISTSREGLLIAAGSPTQPKPTVIKNFSLAAGDIDCSALIKVIKIKGDQN